WRAGFDQAAPRAQRNGADQSAQADAKHARKGRFVLFRELDMTSTKPWLVANFLGAGDASGMFGKPGDGQAVRAEDLGVHVAADLPWCGRKVTQGAVLYVALERRKLVERRAIGFRIKHGLTDLPFAIAGGVHDFRDPRTAAYIAEIAAEVGEIFTQKVG